MTFLPLVHTEEVTGSIPVSPTQLSGQLRSCSWPFLMPVQLKYSNGQRAYRNGLAAEPLAEFLQRVAGGSRGNLGADLHRDGDLAVPQDLHGYTRMYVQRCQQ